MTNNKTTGTSQKKDDKWKVVTIGGVAGVLLGGAGAFVAHAAKRGTTEGEGEETDSDNTDDVAAFGKVAEDVNDDMSFGEAFAAARSEVGAGGCFVWHGNVYGTYYATEWNAMSPDEREAFTATTLGVDTSHSHAPEHTYTAHSSSHHHHTETHQPSSHHPSSPTNSANNTSTQSTAQNTAQNPTGKPTVTPVKDEDDPDDSDFQVIGVQKLEGEQGETMTVGLASVHGKDVYFLDVDEDDKFDYMAYDANNNKKLDEEEFIDIREENVTVSSFQNMAQNSYEPSQPSQMQVNNNVEPEQQEPTEVETYIAQNTDLPDYVNDADPSSLV